MHTTITAIDSCLDIPDYMTVEEIREVTWEDEYLSSFAEIILCNWLSKKLEVQKELQQYGSCRDKIATIDEIAIKARIIIILPSLLDKAIKQLHMNHMDIEKSRSDCMQVNILDQHEH